MATAVRYSLLLLSALVLQRLLFMHLRIDGVAADALLVLAVAVGMVAGPRRGAVVGFVAGLLIDVTVTTPFGLSALSCLVAGSVAGSLERLIVHSARSLAMLVGFLSAFIGLVFFVLVGSILGTAGLIDGHLPIIMILVPASTAALVLPTRRLVRWAEIPSGRLDPALHR